MTAEGAVRGGKGRERGGGKEGELEKMYQYNTLCMYQALCISLQLINSY